MNNKMIKDINDHQAKCINRLKEMNTDTHRAVLLSASYCQDEGCTDYHPCIECLEMSNIAIIKKEAISIENVICGYSFINEDAWQ